MKSLLNRLFKLLYIIIGGFFILFIEWLLNIYVFIPFILIYAVVYWVLFGEFKDSSIITLLDKPSKDFIKLYKYIFNEEL